MMGLELIWIISSNVYIVEFNNFIFKTIYSLNYMIIKNKYTHESDIITFFLKKNIMNGSTK